MANIRLGFATGVFAVLISPVIAAAQAPPPPAPVSFKLPPGISVSAGFGGMSKGSQGVSPVFGASIEVALNRYFVGQGEVLTGTLRFAETWRGYSITGPGGVVGYSGDQLVHNRNRRVDVMGNILVRYGVGRVSFTGGPGFGVSNVEHSRHAEVTGCQPWRAGACSVLPPFDYSYGGLEAAHQWIAGVDVRITRRLTAFGSLRARVGSEDSTFMAGMRTTVREAPVSPGWNVRDDRPRLETAIGEDVHVVAHDSTRRNGRLLGFDGKTIVLAQPNGRLSIPLADVKGVRRKSHAVLKGGLIGAAAGFGYGLLVCSSDCDDAYPLAVGGLFSLIGTGVGMGVGTAINLATADARTLYYSPSPGGLTLTPIVGKERLGIGGIIHW